MKRGIYVANSGDVVGNFSNIELNGSFYNGTTGGKTDVSAKNLALRFVNARIKGVIAASFAKHAKSEFSSDDYRLVGEVTNTPCAAVNNGVIVSLTGSVWTVTGTSCLTALTVANGATINSPNGSNVVMTVDDVVTTIKPGTYKGKIVLTAAK